MSVEGFPAYVVDLAGRVVAARYDDGRLVIDPAGMSVTCDGEPVKLTRKEFALLSALAATAGRVAMRQHLFDTFWGYAHDGDSRTLDAHVTRLRRELAACSGCIETVVGVGYRFIRRGTPREGEGGGGM